jgi:ubiquinone/menaquinone biosynthesis C-methylase UbiE
MTTWKPTPDYEKIADANRMYYAATAEQYDTTETCISDPAAQAMLERSLDEAIDLLGLAPPAIKALDACGGGGNISLKLLKRGVDVTLADISDNLLSIFREKCAADGLEPKTVSTEIAAYLASQPSQYNMIVFSSALHHLQDIKGVLELAHNALKPNGLLLTFFDPTARAEHGRKTRMLLRLDYLMFKLLDQTRDLPPAVLRRLRRIMAHSHPENKGEAALDDNTAGMLAEYHVEAGIDDVSLVADLEAMGFEVVQHVRYAAARRNWVNRVIECSGDVTTFRLVLRKRS